MIRDIGRVTKIPTPLMTWLSLIVWKGDKINYGCPCVLRINGNDQVRTTELCNV